MAKESKMQFTPEAVRLRFWELDAEEAALRAIIDPKQKERDDLVNDAREKELVLNAELKKLKEPLNAIATEKAMLARAISGRVGVDADTPFGSEPDDQGQVVLEGQSDNEAPSVKKSDKTSL